MTNGEPVPKFEEQEPSRLEFEMLISDLSSKLINVVPAELDGVIETALRQVCEVLGIDQAVLWQTSATDVGSFTATHYYSDQVLPHADEMTQEQFPYVREQMLKGRIVCFSSLEELPPEAAADANHAQLLGIKSDADNPIVGWRRSADRGARFQHHAQRSGSGPNPS